MTLESTGCRMVQLDVIENRFDLFKNACKMMDEGKWIAAYILLINLADGCLRKGKPIVISNDG